MAGSIDVLRSKLQSMFSKDFGDIVAQAESAAGVIPGLKGSVHAEAGATISRIAAPNHYSWEFPSETIVEQVAWRELLGLKTGPAEGDSLAGNILKSDSLPGNPKGEDVQESGGNHRGHLCLRSRTGTHHAVEHSREAVGLVRPLW